MGRLNFGKIYEDIYKSSVTADPLVRLVFMDMIILSDADGLMKDSLRSFAHTTHVPLETVERAIKVLSEPDPESWSKAEEGRRIVPAKEQNRGYIVVNKRRYWDKRVTPEEKREAARLRKQQQRERDKSKSPRVVVSRNGADPAPSDVIVRATDGRVTIGGDDVAGFQEKFPDMDVPLELEKIQNFLEYKEGNGVSTNGISKYVLNLLIRTHQKGEYTKLEVDPYQPTVKDLDPHDPIHDGFVHPTGKIYSSIAGKPVEPDEYQRLKDLEEDSP